MTLQLSKTTPRRQTPSVHRLRFQFDTAGTGGVWRPYGNDLVAALPDLLAVLGVRLGPIHRVIYHLDEWTITPRKLANAGRQVRLDGYRHKPAHTIDVLGVSGGRLTVRVDLGSTGDAETIAAQQCWDSEGGSLEGGSLEAG
ncbi:MULTISPECIES: DUF5994 family protein [Nocardia]|uniref:Uncharacterized protein n=1 Tax=Nocardia sputorum TaxID=2984338 RepID=A0ABM8CVI8_9NOCA|nr:DUF5994 family protein [Nocardia sputorum]BDT90377.1 hypothetical protein IFM12275_03530 [Nocardia sputorum]BDT98996.1 hypothetical protein IFM12276_20250 [Nocardia sputorum]